MHGIASGRDLVPEVCEETTTWQCRLLSFLNLIPLTWPTRLLLPAAHVKRPLVVMEWRWETLKLACNKKLPPHPTLDSG
jgi:hypothetical protein